MNPSVINNSASIQNYRGDIAHAIDELQMHLKKTENAIDVVSEGWKDGNFKDFQEHFTEDKDMIKPLCDVLLNYEENILYQLETKLRNYESTKSHL